jgi:signal transduction histidine kinase
MARLRQQAMEQEAALTRELDLVKQFAWKALEYIPDLFATLDNDFNVTYWNAAAAETAARSGNHELGKSIWDLYPAIQGTEIESNLRWVMASRTPKEFEYFNPALEVWFQFRVFPMPADGIIMYVRNTTDARKAEHVLRRSEQLAATGRLAASIAHEINNPLEAITNLLFLAKLDSSVTGDTKNLLELADKELQRLSHIAARSLKFYRQRTAPAETQIDELLDSVLFFHERDIKTRNVTLERRYRPAPAILCQPGEIQQVLTNLIGNALDALPRPGRMIVAVRPARDWSGREGVAVTVADTGQGMDRVTRSRLFHPFVTTKGEEGTGLGLWVSKGIIDKHQGTISVRSKPGRGTVFRFFLPLEAPLPDAN